MSTSLEPRGRKSRGFFPTSALAKSVTCDDHELHVRLQDGRTISVPLQWFPLLRDATPEQREDCEIGGGGISLHWPQIDEDLSVAGLLAGGDQRSM